jgi:acyl-CoA reductase-like NAD-dependent aldehyde dehydrogenase
MTFNGSATCIAPRRVFAHESLAEELTERLEKAFEPVPAAAIEEDRAETIERLIRQALEDGATHHCGGVEETDGLARVRPILLSNASPDTELLKTDIFAPLLSIVPVKGDEAALELDRKCPYALGATIFSEDEEAALALAGRIEAGCVVLNDFLIPTADPRVAFGGRGESGFGVTRGGAGLIEMTRPKTVAIQRADWRPHLTPPDESFEDFFKNYIRSVHSAGLLGRAKAGVAFLREAIRKQKETKGT